MIGERRWKRAGVGGAIVFALVAAACGGSGGGGGGGSFSGVPLAGAGSTFAAPIYTQWAKDFNGIESGAQVNYQAIGSGGGVDAFTKQTVQFGASDAPLQPEQQSALPGDAIEIPTVLGGVSVAYNVKGIDTGLKLDGATIGDIFLRKITSWNDPAIAALNPGVSLPNTPIKPVHRSDDSGTTFVFTTWLSMGSGAWKSGPGAATTVQWPAGEAGKDGSDGVAGYLASTDGSVGYVSYDYAVANHLGVAAVKAQDGSFVAPSVDSISAAGGGLQLPIAPDTNVLNSTAPGAYPLATTTYVMIYANQTDKDQAQTLVDFFTWGLTKGQDSAAQLEYAPLPEQVAQAALQELSKINVGGTPVTASSSVTG
ncbi:MAG: phosphate ABC transporter substrate-binding protein PstS [Actinobacteria bacterium]|nr:phosphate ABC transporter substrate-binding protein PstS [Actinomycetota bacterium]